MKPSNQTAKVLSVVPVLPAAGRSNALAPVPVPSVTTRSIASVTSAATLGSKAAVSFFLTL